MENYVENLRFIREPDNENCSMGIVPANLEVKSDREKRTVIVPELTSMNKFLFDHYRDDMVRYLKEMLRSGYLKEIVGFPFQNKNLYRNNYYFSDVSYWRVDRETLIADVRVDLYLNTGKAIRTWKGFLNLWFHLGEKITCSIEYLGPVEDIADGDLVRLSSYLVPILTNRQVDEAAEAIWTIHMPEALTSPEQRSAVNLAHKMGLSIQYLPVYHHQDTDSILFFEEGELSVRAKKAEDEEDKKPEIVSIPGNTIVINTNRIRQEYSGFNIYHECFHYEEHYLFYRLQKIGNNDPHLIKTKEVTLGEGKKINDPVYWMEKQANRGAYGLLMPLTYMQNLIHTELAKVKTCPHQGYRFQVVGEEIAQRLRIPHFRIRARMIQLGHYDAHGALNYVDRHKIEPFAFDQNAWQEEQQTFIIDKEEAWKLYESDEAFRTEIDSGRYTYADGHIVRNDPTMVRDGINGNRLSIWANSHVDQCCLRFIRQYTQKGVGKYVFGRMNYDAEYVKQTLFYVEKYTMEGETDEFIATKKYKDTFPESFREAFAQIRKQNKLSIEKAAELMNLSDSTLKRWIKEPDDKITIANNSSILNSFKYMLEYSMYKTYCTKYRTHIPKLLKKYREGKDFVVKYKTKRGTVRKRALYNEGFKRKTVAASASCDVIPDDRRYLARTSLMDRLNAKVCEVCGSENVPLEMHHVRKLKNLQGKKYWEELMIARHRKTIAVCVECHRKIHSGLFD